MRNKDASRPQKPGETPRVNRNRREFITTAVLAGGAALLTGIPLGIYVVAPAMGKSIEKWIDFGSPDALPDDGFEMLSYEFLVKDGWQILPQRGFVWARKMPENQFRVFSSTCTHLACNVIWQPETGTFECPCHSGRFDSDGRPVAGPPARPLRELTYKVEADTFKVRMTV
jgi:nitrite reductase/ring-hydroxylating ferredoxin subunit